MCSTNYIQYNSNILQSAASRKLKLSLKFVCIILETADFSVYTLESFTFFGTEFLLFWKKETFSRALDLKDCII